MSAYAAGARSGARRIVSTPTELIVRSGFYAIIIIVLTSLWRAATESSGGNVVGYSAVAITWYLVFAEGAVNGTKFRMIEQIGTDIGSGSVAVEMLRPIRLVAFRIANELGDGVLRLTAMLTVGLVLGFTIAGAPDDTGAFLLALPSAFIAVACNITAQHAFAGMAFWQNEAKGAWYLYQKFVFILGGMLLPIQIFPSWLQTAAWWSPFWTMAYAPARLAAGFYEPWLLVGQLAWLVALMGVASLVFTAGERHIQIGGG